MNLEKFPVEKATLGNDVININQFDEPYYFHDLGLKHTSFCESAICYIDGEQGLLLLRGYPIEQLAKHHDFETVIYLLLNGELPSKEEKSEFVEQIQKSHNIPEHAYAIIKSLPQDTHPMGMLLTLIASLSGQHEETNEHYQTAIKIIAQMPTLVAMCQRHHDGLSPIKPKRNLSYAANYLYMLTGEIPDKLAEEVFDALFILHSEHEQNASTCTMRVTSSTGTNAYAGIASAITALWGPLHGGANEACMNMLEEIKTSDRIPEYIQRAKSKTDPFRLMGFGHRVYKNKDPRSSIMKALCDKVLSKKNDHPLFKLAKDLERHALSDPYFVSHKLYANCDYYSGIVQRAFNIHNNCFTLIFSLARTSGWMSHWYELKTTQATPIIRPRQRYIGANMRNINEHS
tara:strand:+ start:4902 stop:6107 length:1206 start_codon:yes stop_codon:yes gene_type:complete